MSSVEHTSTVDRGLKMKIKRKGLNQKNDHGRAQDTAKTEKDGGGKPAATTVTDSVSSVSISGANGSAPVDKNAKSSPLVDKDKSPKVKVTHKKEKSKDKVKTENVSNGGTSSTTNVSNGLDVLFSQVSMEPKLADTVQVKKEQPVPDPYEFNAKVEDGIGLPVKKMKLEKVCNKYFVFKWNEM